MRWEKTDLSKKQYRNDFENAKKFEISKGFTNMKYEESGNMCEILSKTLQYSTSVTAYLLQVVGWRSLYTLLLTYWKK